ncbi:tetratricopeptide repeat protein [Listeria aquatica]|uniref:Uncharacterized protein n=1 Tax=Listeria aquatica FSL S10-1188 TaxID=1265818 RepID=W7B2S7_9LIST|nr:hypothetical protein [Listeria aquatica]EUJ19720.1 hypothetical protein MAQA_06088 [Listeria aquatica FSL S10-1188]
MKIASFERMKQLVENGKYVDAELESRNMITENPSHFAGYLCLAYLNFASENFSEAAHNLEQALLYNQNIVECYQLGVMIYDRLGEKKRVIELARFGLTLDHEEADFYAALAKYEVDSIKDKAALYETALAYAPKRLDIMGSLAFCLFQMDKTSKRVLALQNTALTADPLFEPNLVYFAKISYARGDFEAAREFTRKLCVIEPSNGEYQALYNQAWATKNPFWSLYERVRLFGKRISLMRRIVLVSVYILIFALLTNWIGYLAVLMWIIPLLVVVVAILSQTERKEKLTRQDRKNRYLRLPLAIILLMLLAFPAGVRTVSTLADWMTPNSLKNKYPITEPFEKQIHPFEQKEFPLKLQK